MEEKIRQLIVFFATTRCSKDNCEIILTENELNDASVKIAAHVFEFIEWMSHNTRVSWSGYIFLHGASFPPKWNTVEEIYEYWITNIKTQEK